MQKADSIPSAGYVADSSTKDENISISSHDTKPDVSGLPLSNPELQSAELSQEYLQKGFVSLVADALTLFGASNDFVSLIRECKIEEIDVSTIEELKSLNSQKATELRNRLSIFAT